MRVLSVLPVWHIAEHLEQAGWCPDLILAHTGWGETLGLKEVWPAVPQILWPELWVRPEHGVMGLIRLSRLLVSIAG